ncbi:MAG: response regulator [Dehalococcoidia bacterium]
MTVKMDTIPQVLTSKPSVLVVDDEPSVRCLLAVLLEGYGYRAMLAADGVEARDAIETAEVALILCDVHLRGESGLTLVQDLLRQSPRTVALMMSGDGVPDQAHGALDEGIYGHIAKPFDLKDVGNRIAQALCGRCLGGAPVQREDTFPWQRRREFTNA